MIDYAVHEATLFHKPISEDQVYGNNHGRDLLEMKNELAKHVMTVEEDFTRKDEV